MEPYLVGAAVTLYLGSAGLVGWLFSLVFDKQDKLDKRLDTLPDTYARRDDVKMDFLQIIATLNRIEDKLDKKQDKT